MVVAEMMMVVWVAFSLNGVDRDRCEGDGGASDFSFYGNGGVGGVFFQQRKH